jgi:hypothetical protein
VSVMLSLQDDQGEPVPGAVVLAHVSDPNSVEEFYLTETPPGSGQYEGCSTLTHAASMLDGTVEAISAGCPPASANWTAQNGSVICP